MLGVFHRKRVSGDIMFSVVAVGSSTASCPTSSVMEPMSPKPVLRHSLWRKMGGQEGLRFSSSSQRLKRLKRRSFSSHELHMPHRKQDFNSGSPFLRLVSVALTCKLLQPPCGISANDTSHSYLHLGCVSLQVAAPSAPQFPWSP